MLDSVLGITYKGSPIWAIALTLLVPALIIYLSLHPNEPWGGRGVRIGLLPLALWGMWVMSRTYVIILPADIQFYELSILCTLSAGIRYSLTTSKPTFHPLPRQPPLAFLRNNDLFRTFNILASEFRHINIPPSKPLPRRTEPGGTGRGYFSSIVHHLTHMIIQITIMDILLYPAYFLDPNGIGSPDNNGGDLTLFCKEVGGRGWWVVWGWMGFAIAAATLVAMMGTYHMFALVGVASGIWIDEEWPELTDQAWKADSLNDLWGKRYHQLLRDVFILWAKPFSKLPKPIHILSIFTASAIFHILIYAPLTREYIYTPYLTFYILQGIGCILERAFYKISHKKVGGWGGRVWMWVWLGITGIGMVEEYYRIGWVGGMRGKLVEGGMSPAEWIAGKVGLVGTGSL